MTNNIDKLTLNMIAKVCMVWTVPIFNYNAMIIEVPMHLYSKK